MWYLLLVVCLSGDCRIYPFVESQKTGYLHTFKSEQECLDASHVVSDNLERGVIEAKVFEVCIPFGEQT